MNRESETFLGVDSKTKGALCYIPFIGWIISPFFILTEREDHFVRFNALQSLMLLFTYLIAAVVFNKVSVFFSATVYVGYILALIKDILFPGYMVISALLIFKGYKGERLMLPKLGVVADKQT